MAENKKSFVLYTENKELFDSLTNEQAGILIKHIFSYVNDENPVIDDKLINIAFLPIKQNLKRDLKKWENIKTVRSESGKLGGRPKKQTKAKEANALLEKQTKAKKAVNVNDNVNDNVINKTKLDLVIDDFEKMRKTLKKPLTDAAKIIMLKKLEILSKGNEDIKIQILEQSIFNSWQGIFELKWNNNTKKLVMP